MRRPITRGTGLLAGLAAMVVTEAIILLLRGTTPILAPSDLVEDRITSLVPITLFSTVLDTLRFKAKPLLYLSILIGQLAVGALIGLAYAAYLRRRTREVPVHMARLPQARWRHAAVLASLLWIVSEVLILPILGDGLFGIAHRPALRGFHLALLGEFLVFSMLVVWLVTHEAVRRMARMQVAPTTLTRRDLLLNAATGVAALGLGTLAVKVLVFKPDPALGFKDEEGMQSDVTPLDSFYTVSKNFVNPAVDASGWQLQIGGLVERSRTYTYNQIKALPGAVDQYGTLECISNGVGGDLMSNGLWRGVKLADLLKDAGIRPDAKRLVLTAADGYTDSFTIEKAMQPTVILAYSLNGETLTTDHGFPVRLVVPGIFGMKNVKWLTKIEPSADDKYLGFWQTRGWDNNAIVKTMSRIDVPHLGQNLKPGPQHIGGVAFAGDRGIQKVEVSTDGGITWQEARLKDPLGPFTWVLWQIDWNPGPDSDDLVVRAVDKTGSPQIATEADPVPDGASGYHHVKVVVA